MARGVGNSFRNRKVSDKEIEAAPRALVVNEKTLKTAHEGDYAATRAQKKYDRAAEKQEQAEAKQLAKQQEQEAKQLAKQQEREATETRHNGKIEITRYTDKQGRQVIEGKNHAEQPEEKKQGFFSKLFGPKEGRIGGNGYDRSQEYAQPQKQQLPSNKDVDYNYAQMGAPKNWGVPSSELKAALRAEPNKIHGQEQKGNSRVSFCTLAMYDGNGKEVYVRSCNGMYDNGTAPGVATGTGNVDPRYGKVIPEKDLSNYRQRHEKPSFAVYDEKGKVQFSVDVAERSGTRTNLRIHPDGGKLGTGGCDGIHPSDARKFESAISSRDDRGMLNGMKLAYLPSQDQSNNLVQAQKKARDVAENAETKVRSHEQAGHSSKPTEVMVAQLDRSKANNRNN